MAFISPIYARCLCRHLLGNGVAAPEIFAGTGVDYMGLWHSDDLDVGVFRRILENAERIGTDPPVGFLIGSMHNTSTLGPLGAAMGAAPTLRASLQLLETYTRVHAEYVQIQSLAGPHSLVLQFQMQEIYGESLRHHMESLLTFLEGFVQTMTGRPLEEAIYSVTYAPPDYVADYPRYLQSPVIFDQPQLSAELPLLGMDEPSPYHHEGLWRSSLLQLSERLRELGTLKQGVYSDHVQSILRSHQLPLPALGDIASSMNVSERTLNRRLQDEGTSYRELRGEVIDRWARQYLDQTDLSVEAIAGALGYQDAANFRRAFRKRQGMAPGQYRQGLEQA